VEVDWDPAKAASNLAKHGISFDKAIGYFYDDNRVEEPDQRKDYGEERWHGVAMVDGILLFVVYTRRGEGVRLISARKANRREKRAYRIRQG
jgi:uncharacterized DUF497 family protein